MFMFREEENPIIKLFTIEGESTWVKAKRRTKCVLRIWPESMNLEVEVLKGVSPYKDDLVSFILKDKDVRLLVRKYQQKGRIRPYSMNVQTGMSGCSTVYINYTDEYGLNVEGKRLLHVSCYDKLDGLGKMYVGDFVEAVVAYGFNTEFKTTGKYNLRPFVSEDFGTEVHKII